MNSTHHISLSGIIKIQPQIMKIGCSTPVKARPLMLRSCILQMQAQTRLPDTHLILINGVDALDYDSRTVTDLINQRVQFKAYPYDANTSELTVQCLKIMLEQGVDLFFKIDSDDMYYCNYIETFLEEIGEEKLAQTEKAFAANLVDQLFITAQDNTAVKIKRAHFQRGLGLPPHEIEKGIKVGAPPTYVFNRKAAQLIVDNADNPKYRHLTYDDAMMRNLLFDHGVVIDQITTKEPIFGYVRHGSNISSIKPHSKATTGSNNES